jgi:hypothetical protein
MSMRQLTNIYCSSCASDKYLPKVRNIGYNTCILCGKDKSCYAATMQEIQDYQAGLHGRKIA